MSHPALLGVNIDHVATLRQVRGTRYPDPLEAAIEAENAGADAITVHLREDRRHIQDDDVRRIRETSGVRMNLELAVTEEMIRFAAGTRPSDCCLVPERREELTTEGGLDVAARAREVAEACAHLGAAGIRVSLFVDPEPRQLEAAKNAGADVVELHTGRYADAADPAARNQEFRRLDEAMRAGLSLGLGVNAGHGLNYENVAPIAALDGIAELNIGHAIVSRAVFVGLGEAVAEMKRRMAAARGAKPRV